MEYISKKVAYLKGLTEGMKLDKSSEEGRIITAMLDIFEDITDALDGLSEAHNDLQDYVEMIDDDMTDLEDYLLGEYDSEDNGVFDEDFDESLDEDDLYEVICPKCGEEYLTDFESFEADDVICPHCGEKFVLDDSVVEKLKQADACMHEDIHD